MDLMLLYCDAGSHSRFVGSFDFIGPFPIGKSEIDADPVALLGGVYTLRSQTALRIPRYEYYTYFYVISLVYRMI